MSGDKTMKKSPANQVYMKIGNFTAETQRSRRGSLVSLRSISYLLTPFRCGLVAATVLAMSGAAQAQTRILAWDFTGESNNVASIADIISADLDSTNALSRGPGAAASAGGNSFRTTGFQNNGISTNNTDYFQFALSAANGKVLSLSTIDCYLAGTTSFATSPGTQNQFAYSLDGNAFTLIGSPVTRIGNGALTQINLSSISALQNVPAGTTVTFRFYATGQTTTGGWGFNSTTSGAYGLDIGGTISSASAGAPVITSPTATNAVAYANFSYQIQAANSPTSFNATGLPTGLSVDTATGIISGQPTTPGSYNIVISATNTDGSGSATLALTVTKNPGAPTITSALATNASVGTSFSYQIVADNNPTGYGATNLPTGLTVDTATGLISGTPTAAGTRNVTITATNSLGLDSQTLVITTSAPPTITSGTSGSIYSGGAFSYTITASATPAIVANGYGATNLPDGLTLDTATGIISGTPTGTGLLTFTVSADNGVGVATANYSLNVVTQAAQDAIPLSVVVNKYLNTPDTIELLVIGDGTTGSTADLRGMILKDFSSSNGSDGGGKFQFSSDPLWAAVKAGTLIVLSPGITGTEDLNDSDFVLAVKLGNTTYFSSGGGSFDVGTDDMVMIKAAGTGFTGVAGGVHALAAGTAGAQYNAFSGKKLRPATGTTAGGFGVRAKNSTSQASDYYGTGGAAGTDAEASIALASLSFGSFNTAGNDAFIKTLRGVVDGSGLASIVNGLSGSAYLGKNVFPRNQVGQTVEIVFTPSSTATAIERLEIEVPALFGVPVVGNVTVSGTGTGSAIRAVVGQKVTISGLNAISPNPVTIRIAGLSSPDTSDAVTNNGSYTFNIQSAGVGGSLSALGVSPSARVIIPIANLKNIDPTTRVPVLNGQTVAVEGVCLVARLGSGSTSTVLQEGNSGVQVYSLSAVQGPQIRGNKYTAVGTVGQNFGITQIVMTDASLMFDQGADVLPAPTVVTIPVFNAAPETYENRLIRIENLTYVSGTFGTSQSVIFQDASLNQLTVRIQSASTATAQPNGTVTITGIGGQFDNASPFDTGYQLQPRDLDDMPAPPTITTTTFTGKVGAVFSNKIASAGTPVITASNALPAGLSLDSATGWITGTPTTASTNGLIVGFVATNAYGTNTADITFTIAKGTPTIATPPTASAITEGQTLASSTLTGGSATGIGSTLLSGSFGWNNPTFAPPLGTANYGAIFTPSGADADNWDPSANTNVSVTVNPATPSGSSFSGWLGTNNPSAALLMQYAYGAASASNTANRSNLPSSVLSNNSLVMTYYVRKEATNPNLVTPQVHTNLSDASGWGALASSNIATVATNTVDGVEVVQKKATVPVEGTRKFLRLKIAE
jgi:hypothetical protein